MENDVVLCHEKISYVKWSFRVIRDILLGSKGRKLVIMKTSSHYAKEESMSSSTLFKITRVFLDRIFPIGLCVTQWSSHMLILVATKLSKCEIFWKHIYYIKILFSNSLEVLCSLAYVNTTNISFDNFSTECTNMVVDSFVVQGVVTVLVGIPYTMLTHTA